MADAFETLVKQINFETVDWIKLKIKKLIEKYKRQLSTRQILCDASDWFTVQVIDKFYEIGEVLNRSREYLAYLFEGEVQWVEISIEERDIYVYCTPSREYPGQFRILQSPYEKIVNFRYVDHKNLGEILEKLKDKVEELLSLMEKKFQEVIQAREETLEQWRQSKICLELSSEKIKKEFEKGNKIKISGF